MAVPEDHIQQTEPLLGQFNRLAAQIGKIPQLAQENGGANVDMLVPKNNQEGEKRLKIFDTILGMRLWDILHTGAVATDTNFKNICDTTLYEPFAPSDLRSSNPDHQTSPRR